MMAGRIPDITLWSYKPSTPDEVILRHGRIAQRVMGAGFGAGGLMSASLLEFLLSPPGWWRDLWMYALVALTAVALLMLLPAVFAYMWTHEIARECGRREIDSFDIESIDKFLQIAALKSVVYFLAVLLIARFMPQDSIWHAAIVVVAAAILFWSLIRAGRSTRKEQRSPADF